MIFRRLVTGGCIDFGIVASSRMTPSTRDAHEHLLGLRLEVEVGGALVDGARR